MRRIFSINVIDGLQPLRLFPPLKDTPISRRVHQLALQLPRFINPRPPDRPQSVLISLSPGGRRRRRSGRGTITICEFLKRVPIGRFLCLLSDHFVHQAYCCSCSPVSLLFANLTRNLVRNPRPRPRNVLAGSLTCANFLRGFRDRFYGQATTTNDASFCRVSHLI